MDKRYQVFVSSTYEDLKEERKEVMQVLLESNCFPAGMELFQAANSDQWTVIKRVIDECDYYLLIVGGRYGSVNADGVSYTEMEYRYALEKEKPIISFYHGSPENLTAAKTESKDEGKEKLAAFLVDVKTRLCSSWENASELAGKVSRSINNLKRDEPSVGWVRADAIDLVASGEIIEYKERIEELTNEISDLKFSQPAGTDDFSQGDDLHEIVCSFFGHQKTDFSYEDRKISEEKLSISWNKICACLLPFLIKECTDNKLQKHLENFLGTHSLEALGKRKFAEWRKKGRYAGFYVQVSQEELHKVLFQLKALGLIELSERGKSVKITDTFWTLTAYGDIFVTRLMAIKRTS